MSRPQEKKESNKKYPPRKQSPLLQALLVHVSPPMTLLFGNETQPWIWKSIHVQVHTILTIFAGMCEPASRAGPHMAKSSSRVNEI